MATKADNCEFCHSANLRPLDARGGARLVQCNRCRAAWLADFPGAEVRDAQYQETYRRRENGERFSRPIEAVLRRLHAGRARWIRRRCPDAGRMLDIGCGRGDLLRACAELGWSAEGVEVSRALEGIDLGPGVTVHIGDFMTLPLEPGFTLITAFHVLEHLPDFPRVIERIESLCAPNASLVFEVPNAASVLHRWFGSAWFGRDLPNHIYQFTPPALRRFLETRGWRHIRSRQWSLEFGPYSTGQTLANAVFPRFHNALYNALQSPRPSPAELGRAAAQLPFVVAGVMAYPLLHVLTAPFQRSEIIRMHFHKP